MNFPGGVKRKDNLMTLILVGYIEGKRGRIKYLVIYLTSLTIWMLEQGIRIIVRRETTDSVAVDLKFWRVVITHNLKEHDA